MGGSINGLYLVTIAFILCVVIGQFVLKKTKLEYIFMLQVLIENRPNYLESILIKYV